MGQASQDNQNNRLPSQPPVFYPRGGLALVVTFLVLSFVAFYTTPTSPTGVQASKRDSIGCSPDVDLLAQVGVPPGHGLAESARATALQKQRVRVPVHGFMGVPAPAYRIIWVSGAHVGSCEQRHAGACERQLSTPSTSIAQWTITNKNVVRCNLTDGRGTIGMDENVRVGPRQPCTVCDIVYGPPHGEPRMVSQRDCTLGTRVQAWAWRFWI